MEEIKVLVDNYDSQHNLASTGFHLGGQKYFYLRYLHLVPLKYFLFKYFNTPNLLKTQIILHYLYSGNDDVMRGKQGKGGVHVVKTNQVVKFLRFL